MLRSWKKKNKTKNLRRLIDLKNFGPRRRNFSNPVPNFFSQIKINRRRRRREKYGGEFYLVYLFFFSPSGISKVIYFFYYFSEIYSNF